ncbi:hypothetical protein SAFG77S_11347 [Streptomyces afghaniensis]
MKKRIQKQVSGSFYIKILLFNRYIGFMLMMNLNGSD